MFFKRAANSLTLLPLRGRFLSIPPWIWGSLWLLRSTEYGGCGTRWLSRPGYKWACSFNWAQRLHVRDIITLRLPWRAMCTQHLTKQPNQAKLSSHSLKAARLLGEETILEICILTLLPVNSKTVGIHLCFIHWCIHTILIVSFYVCSKYSINVCLILVMVAVVGGGGIHSSNHVHAWQSIQRSSESI